MTCPDMQLVDSHCHLNFPEFDGRLPDILQNAADLDVSHVLCISTAWENQAEVLTMADTHPNVFAAVGKHPTTDGGFEPTSADIVAAAAHPRVVGIGETGLDYFRSSGDLDWQHQRFHAHIDAAVETDMPLIIHTRAAAADTLETLRTQGADRCGGVMHCFAEDWDVARQALDIGFYISFSGIVTFKSAANVQEVARRAPLDRILVETDAPYLAPVPHRGKTNEPAYVRHTAEFVAALRDIPLEQLAEATTDNFFRLFHKARA